MSDIERTKAMKKVIKAVGELSIYEALGVLSCAGEIICLRNQKAIKKYWIDDFDLNCKESSIKEGL